MISRWSVDDSLVITSWVVTSSVPDQSSVRSITFLSFIVLTFAWNVPLASLIFLKRSLVFPFYCFPLFLCTNHWGSLSYLSLLFFGTLHSNGYIFPFLLCLSLIFFSQLFVSPPQTTILPFCISFPLLPNFWHTLKIKFCILSMCFWLCSVLCTCSYLIAVLNTICYCLCPLFSCLFQTYTLWGWRLSIGQCNPGAQGLAHG